MGDKQVWAVIDLDCETKFGHVRMVASTDTMAYNFANKLEKGCNTTPVTVAAFYLDRDLALED